MALDSCFPGAGGRSVLAILSAPAADELTGSKDAEGHGIFTYYLLKRLSGAAKDGTGRITPKSLYNYLKPKVRDDARR